MRDYDSRSMAVNPQQSKSLANLEWLTVRIERAIELRDFEQAVQCVGLLDAVVDRCRLEYQAHPGDEFASAAAAIGKRLQLCTVQLTAERNNMARKLLRLRRGKRMIRQTIKVVPVFRAAVRIDRTT